jgi:hypothetical protein
MYKKYTLNSIGSKIYFNHSLFCKIYLTSPSHCCILQKIIDLKLLLKNFRS